MPPASGCVWGVAGGGGPGTSDVGSVLGVVVVSVGDVSVVGVSGDDAADCVGVAAVVGAVGDGVVPVVGVVAVVGTGVVPVVPPAACVPGAAGGETVAAEAPGCGASDGGAAGLNPGGGVVPTVSPAGGDCPGGPGSTPSGVSVGATGGTGMFFTGGVAASSDAGPAGRTGAPIGVGGGTGATGCACSRDVGPVTGASGGVTGGAGGAGGGGSRLFSVGCGVDGTSVAPLAGGGAVVGACETTGDCGTGFDPAGQRADELESDGDALCTGQREVAFLSVDLLADVRVVVDESSTGRRDVAFLSADFCGDVDESPVTGHREVSLSAPSPTSGFGFGFTDLGASAAARSRAAFAAALFGSKRGGSVCFLT